MVSNALKMTVHPILKKCRRMNWTGSFKSLLLAIKRDQNFDDNKSSEFLLSGQKLPANIMKTELN